MRLLDGIENAPEVQLPIPQRQETTAGGVVVLQMHQRQAVGVLAHGFGRVPAAGGQVGSVGAEADAGLGEDGLQLLGGLHDRAQMRMEAGAQAVALGDLRHGVQRATEPLVVVLAGAGRADGATT